MKRITRGLVVTGALLLAACGNGAADTASTVQPSSTPPVSACSDPGTLSLSTIHPARAGQDKVGLLPDLEVVSAMACEFEASPGEPAESWPLESTSDVAVNVRRSIAFAYGRTAEPASSQAMPGPSSMVTVVDVVFADGSTSRWVGWWGYADAPPWQTAAAGEPAGDAANVQSDGDRLCTRKPGYPFRTATCVPAPASLGL